MNSNTKVYIAIPLIVIIFIFSYISITDKNSPPIEKENVTLDQDGQTPQAAKKDNVSTSIEKENETLGQNSQTQQVVTVNSKASIQIQEDIDIDNQHLLTVILGLVTLVSLLTTFWLYRWRRVVIAGRDIVVPETFAKQVESIINVVSASSKELSGIANEQTGKVGQFRKSLEGLDQNIQNMIETYMSLQSSLDQKDNEIARFKEGYDSKVFHDFLLRFTRVDRVIQEYLEDNKIDLNGLEDIHEVMKDALEECGVEEFSPSIGEDYLSLEGVAGNPKKIYTEDEAKNHTICKVIKAGYRRKMPDSRFEIIAQAKVSIYFYKAIDREINELQEDNKLKE